MLRQDKFGRIEISPLRWPTSKQNQRFRNPWQNPFSPTGSWLRYFCNIKFFSVRYGTCKSKSKPKHKLNRSGNLGSLSARWNSKRLGQGVRNLGWVGWGLQWKMRTRRSANTNTKTNKNTNSKRAPGCEISASGVWLGWVWICDGKCDAA